MRDEECDWYIYHIVAAKQTMTVAELAGGIDLPPHVIEASVNRLIHSRLIERSGDTLRPLSFQDMILLQQIEQNPECPFVIEEGVIKVRKDWRC